MFSLPPGGGKLSVWIGPTRRGDLRSAIGVPAGARPPGYGPGASCDCGRLSRDAVPHAAGPSLNPRPIRGPGDSARWQPSGRVCATPLPRGAD